MLTTPAVRAVRRAHRDAWITYLVEPGAAPVVEGNPHLNEVIVAPLSRGLARWRDDLGLARRLRRARFDAVVDFHGGPRSSWLALATGAPVRVGYTVAGRSWMYTHRVFRPRGHRLRHSVENQWDLVEALLPGVGRPGRGTDPVEMPDDPGAASRMANRLAGIGVGIDHRLIVVHVGAGNEFRRWPEAAFADAVATLSSADPNRRIILTTGAAQAGAARAIRDLAVARAGANPAAIVAWCDLGLADLRSLLERSAVFVGGDSGPAHVAATTATPMVVIYGPTLPAVWGPWRSPSLVTEVVEAGALSCRPCDQRRCDPGDFRCLRGIPAAQLVAAVERALQRDAARGEP